MFSRDFEATETTRAQLSKLELEARAQIQMMTELDGLHFTKEEKEVLKKWRDQWENGSVSARQSEKNTNIWKRNVRNSRKKNWRKLPKRMRQNSCLSVCPGKKNVRKLPGRLNFGSNKHFCRTHWMQGLRI